MSAIYKWRTWDDDGACIEWTHSPRYLVSLGMWGRRGNGIGEFRRRPDLDRKRGGAKAIRRIKA